MKSGIVRRIDELGRVVIPKEIRRTMRIKEGEELEVIVKDDDELLLRKYSQIKNMSAVCSEYADLLCRHTGHNCIICDTGSFICSAQDRALWEGKPITKRLENLLKERKSIYLKEEKNLFPFANNYTNVALAPIISRGDLFGGIMLADEKFMTMPDTLVRFLEIGADYLAGQTE